MTQACKGDLGGHRSFVVAFDLDPAPLMSVQKAVTRGYPEQETWAFSFSNKKRRCSTLSLHREISICENTAVSSEFDCI